MFSDKAYDVFCKIQRWLPLIGLLYLSISSIWHLPYGDEVNQTIVALATFLAGTLEIANTVYLMKKEKKEFKQLDIIDFDLEEGDDLDE